VILHRKRLPAELAGAYGVFEEVLAEVEPAKAALTDVMPTTRLLGRPLAEALLEFEARVGRARELMPSWRRPQVEDVWTACDTGLDASLERARRLREEAPELGGFEGLIWVLGSLLDPLEAFERAALRFRELRA
jgi:hypothetical protein